jgi:hypothetical protein
LPGGASACAAGFIAAQYDTVAVAAEGCDVLLATGRSHFVAQSVAEEVAIPHRYATFCPNVLNDPDAQSWNALFGGPIKTDRASIDLPPVEDVREFMFTDHPWLAANPILGPWQERWISPSRRPLRGSCGRTPTPRPSWWRSWTPAHHRCTWASAVCASRKTAPGPPSRRSAQTAAAHSSPTAGPSWP